MKSSLEIHLLGPFQVLRNGEAVTTFEADTARALLAYLALHPGIPVPRESLAALLWPDQASDRALHALSQALNRLRKAIADPAVPTTYLLATRDTIQLNAQADYELDVAEFTRLLAVCRQHDHRDVQVCGVCIHRLEQAAALYRADLLKGFFLDSREFEEWLVIQREQLHRQVIDTLYTLGAYSERRGQYEIACQYAWRQLELEPWREEAHRQLMRSMARSGQRSAALAQYRRCCQVLLQEFGIEPDNETTALHAHIQAGKLDTPVISRHNLPAPLTPFLGRQAELARIGELINRIDSRLLTLVGPGGVGKTRLALQAAAAEVGMFRHGVYFVPLSAVNASELAAFLAQVMQFPLEGSRSPWQQLYDFLRAKEVLLVLDSFEHLLGEAAHVAALLSHAPHVRVLVASRERLNVQGEFLLPIDGLSYPERSAADGDETVPADWDAVRLFAQHANRIQPGFTLAAAGPAVVRICQLVEGMPLAIELAAARLRMFSCEDIACEIERDLDFLKTSLQDVPQRHRSLRAVFDHSWAILPPEERTAFQRLSIFCGSFDRFAAERAAGITPALLTALVDKSLLRQELDSRGRPRYELHHLLNRYAAEKLAAAPDADRDVRHAHCTHYLAWLAECQADIQGEAPHQALDAIGLEIGNVRVAWDWAVQTRLVEVLGQALESMFLFYDLRCRFQEGEVAFDKIAQGFGAAQVPGEGLVLGRALACQGWFAFRLGSRPQAESLLQRALPLLRQLGTPGDVAVALNSLAAIAANASAFSRGTELCQESLALCRQAHQTSGAARALNILGQVAYSQGSYEEARRYCHESLDMVRASGRYYLEADSLCRLGNAAFLSSQHSEAWAYYEQALRCYRAFGNLWGESVVLNNLFAIAFHRGDHTGAQSHLEQALAIKRLLGDRRGIANGMSNLGVMALDQGNYMQADTCYREALLLSRETGARAMEGRVLSNLGNLWISLGCYEEAQSCLEQSLAIRREVGDRRGEGITLASLGRLFHQVDRQSSAQAYSQQALALAQALGDRGQLANAQMHLGNALAALGCLDEAVQAYAQSLDLRRTLGEAHKATEPQAGLAGMALAQGDFSGALAHVEDILCHVAAHRLVGPDDPLRVYLICYQVLHAGGDARAGKLFDEGYNLLQERASRLGDEYLRRSLLENVPAHRMLVSLQRKLFEPER
ncbi:MAG: AfsR/SARP family transcriptional regulator [Chloroflexota bacterium]